MSRGYRDSREEHKGRGGDGRHAVRTPRLSIVKPVPRNRLVPGVVVWAHVPFDDEPGEKTRPAVVVSASAHDVVVHPVTTTPKRHHYPDRYVEIIDLTDAGVIRPCAVATRTVEVPRIDLINITGELSTADAERVFGAGVESDTVVDDRRVDVC